MSRHLLKGHLDSLKKGHLIAISTVVIRALHPLSLRLHSLTNKLYLVRLLRQRRFFSIKKLISSDSQKRTNLFQNLGSSRDWSLARTCHRSRCLFGHRRLRFASRRTFHKNRFQLSQDRASSRFLAFYRLSRKFVL